MHVSRLKTFLKLSGNFLNFSTIFFLVIIFFRCFLRCICIHGIWIFNIRNLIIIIICYIICFILCIISSVNNLSIISLVTVCYFIRYLIICCFLFFLFFISRQALIICGFDKLKMCSLNVVSLCKYFLGFR